MTCDQIQQAAMARADGFDPGIPATEIAAHLAVCETCRAEVASFAGITAQLGAQHRVVESPDLWPAVERALPRARSNWVYVALAVGLLIYKLIEFIPNRRWGVAVRLVPIVFAAALLFYLKQNPFQINTELRLEEE